MRQNWWPANKYQAFFFIPVLIHQYFIWENILHKGYAYANVWKDRSAYRGTVEVTVYVESTAKGKGIGNRLYAALLERLQAECCLVFTVNF
jgi:L-amino acid N-acyltransferase YncA